MCESVCMHLTMEMHYATRVYCRVSDGGREEFGMTSLIFHKRAKCEMCVKLCTKVGNVCLLVPALIEWMTPCCPWGEREGERDKFVGL